MPDSDSEAFESADEEVTAVDKNKRGMKIDQISIKIIKFKIFSSNSAQLNIPK